MIAGRRRKGDYTYIRSHGPAKGLPPVEVKTDAASEGAQARAAKRRATSRPQGDKKGHTCNFSVSGAYDLLKIYIKPRLFDRKKLFRGHFLTYLTCRLGAPIKPYRMVVFFAAILRDGTLFARLSCRPRPWPKKSAPQNRRF